MLKTLTLSTSNDRFGYHAWICYLIGRTSECRRRFAWVLASALAASESKVITVTTTVVSK
jgi:hypothetical protein